MTRQVNSENTENDEHSEKTDNSELSESSEHSDYSGSVRKRTSTDRHRRAYYSSPDRQDLCHKSLKLELSKSTLGTTMSVAIESRRELFDFFQRRVEGTHEQLSEEQELEHQQNMLKSFVIESNISAEELGEHTDLTDHREVDYALEELRFRNGDNGELTFYLDHENPRFWTLYTLEKSRPAKEVINGFMTGVSNGLDYVWFPEELQNEISTMGEFRGLGVKYKADEVFPEEYIKEEFDFGDLSLQTRGRGTRNLYEKLSSDEELQSFLSVSSVGIRREVNGSFVIERISNDGQFTTRGGDSIQLHLDTLETIRDRYAELLRNIEENHRISYPSHEGGTRVEGSPLIIELNNEIKDIEQFISGLVSSKNPLRLWGAKSKLDEDYYKVKGVDLHNSDKFTIEVTPEWLRLYLSEDACGNTALRIYANIQRYYDSEASMVGVE